MHQSNNKKMIVKVTMPRILVDNPMCCFSTRDGSWTQTVPVNQQIVKFMKGEHEAYFELVMSNAKIVSMRPCKEELYTLAEKPNANALPN